MKYVFGTSSKWRQQFFDQFGFDYTVMPAEIDERAIRLDDPKELTVAIAKAKTDALLKIITEPVILITFDQVVVCNGLIYEKPKNEAELRRFWKSYRKYHAQTYSAVVATDSASGQQLSGVDVAGVYFKTLPNKVLLRVLGSDDAYTTSGGFMVNCPLTDPYIKKIEGTIDSVMGIPMVLTQWLIQQLQLTD